MKKLQDISDINIDSKEGRYLMAALVKIATESQTDKTPDEVLEQCHILQEEMYKEHPERQESVLNRPCAHHLIDIFKELKFGRPAASQKYLQNCIEELEEKEFVVPEDEIIKLLYANKKIKTTSIQREFREGKNVWVLYINGKDRMQTETNDIKELLQMVKELDIKNANFLIS